MLPQYPLSTQTCGSPVTQPARVKEGYLRPYHHYKKELHVYKNKTSTLRSNNTALPPILCSLSLTTSHPLGVSRPSFMFKDYLLIQNVQEHETTGKGPILWGEGGMHGFICLLAFIIIHWNTVPFPLFSGHV